MSNDDVTEASANSILGPEAPVPTIEEGPEPSSPAESLDSVSGFDQDISAIAAAVTRLTQQLSADQDIIGRMHSRIETLQGDQVRALLAPAVTELANLHAEFAEAADRNYEELGFDRVRREFAMLSNHIETAIDLLGAISLDVQVGDEFDSRVHQAVKKIPTADPSIDKTIAAVIRQGFTFDPSGRPALYARVRVHNYEPPPGAADVTKPGADGAAHDVPQQRASAPAAHPVSTPDAPAVTAPSVESAASELTDDELNLPFTF